MAMKIGYSEVDNIIEHSASRVVTLDEESYKPFTMSKEIIKKVETKESIPFVIKTSSINWKMQSLNLIQVRDRIMEYLKELNYICLHARHFNVPYDIIVFENITMVDPMVEWESEVKSTITEVALDGTTRHVKRSNQLRVSFIDEYLKHQTLTLDKFQSACFSHYEF